MSYCILSKYLSSTSTFYRESITKHQPNQIGHFNSHEILLRLSLFPSSLIRLKMGFWRQTCELESIHPFFKTQDMHCVKFLNQPFHSYDDLVHRWLFAKLVQTLLFSVTPLFRPVPVLNTIDQLSSEQPNSTAKAILAHFHLLQVFGSVCFHVSIKCFRW